MNTHPTLPGSPAQLQSGSHLLLAELWQQFNTRFPTNKECLEELCKRACHDGTIRCRHCGSQALDTTFSARVVACRQCGQSTWLTAGTFFHHIRLPRAWLAAIWFMERGINISSCQFHKLVGIAYSTAWHIFNKLATVIQSEMGDTACTLPSSLFSPLICKRSRNTPARSHPLAEEEHIGGSLPAQPGCAGLGDHRAAGEAWEPPRSLAWQPAGKTDSVPESAGDSKEGAQPGPLIDSPPMSAREQELYEVLKEREVHFDAICVRTGLPAGEVSSLLTFLELAGHIRRRAGDRYVRTIDDKSVPSGKIGNPRSGAWPELAAPADALVKAVIDFVHKHYQGISRKYLQNYLSAYWCHIDRGRWHPGSLLQACFRFGPIRNDEIRSCVSTALVKVLPWK